MVSHCVVSAVVADFEPDDVLTDPGLRSQLTNAAGDRLPETHIRSIPDLGDEVSTIRCCDELLLFSPV